MSGLGRLEKAQRIVEAALDRKAEDPVVLDVRQVTSYADTFVILSGRSDRQVRAIAEEIALQLKQAGDPPLGVEGLGENRWVLIDAGDVVVHVFNPETRAHYALERLWSDAPVLEVELPEGAVENAGERAR